MKKLLLASDPELFTRTSCGKLSSVAGKLGCDKYNKIDLGSIRLQEDNVLVEFDIDPSDNFAGFNALIKRGIAESEKAIKPHGLEIAKNICSHIYTTEELNSFDPSAFVFGCEPDFNGLTGMKNPRPVAVDAGLRSAGGHIHFGFDDKVSVGGMEQMAMTIMCDFFLGLPSVLLDNDTRRRELYGKAGSIRYKPYGIEYRTLSNFWIFSDKGRKWAWDQGNKAYNFIKDINDARMLASMVSPDEVQRVINQDDKVMAEQYIKLMEIM